MNTTTEVLTVNGVVLNTLAKNIETLAGRLRTPAYRTENVVVPGRHGALRTPHKRFDQNNLILPMWVVGSDDDGRIPTGSTKRREFYKRVDELTRLFKGGTEELDIRHTLPDGSIRQTFGDAMDVFDFTTDASPKGLFTVNILLYYPAWQDLEVTSQSLSASGNSVTATDFAESTFPMEDMSYTIAGPWTNPLLTFADGSWVTYDGVVGTDQTLTINSGDWTLAGTGGLTPDYTKLRHDGRDAFWAALPATSQKITLDGSGRSSASSLYLTGRRKYLVG